MFNKIKIELNLCHDLQREFLSSDHTYIKIRSCKKGFLAYYNIFGIRNTKSSLSRCIGIMIVNFFH